MLRGIAEREGRDTALPKLAVFIPAGMVLIFSWMTVSNAVTAARLQPMLAAFQRAAPCPAGGSNCLSTESATVQSVDSNGNVELVLSNGKKVVADYAAGQSVGGDVGQPVTVTTWHGRVVTVSDGQLEMRTPDNPTSLNPTWPVTLAVAIVFALLALAMWAFVYAGISVRWPWRAKPRGDADRFRDWIRGDQIEDVESS